MNFPLFVVLMERLPILAVDNHKTIFVKQLTQQQHLTPLRSRDQQKNVASVSKVPGSLGRPKGV